MKNSEEDILKRFLQDTFSDYEPEPGEQSWENIRKEIQPHQPKMVAGLRQWIMPVVALLLLIGGIITWNKNSTENKIELAINSTENKASVINYSQNNESHPSEIPLSRDDKNTLETETNEGDFLKVQPLLIDKAFVNNATLKVENTVLLKTEKLLEMPASLTIMTESSINPKVEEHSVSTNGFAVINDKSAIINVQEEVNSQNIFQKNNPVEDLRKTVITPNIPVNSVNNTVSNRSDTERQVRENNTAKKAKQPLQATVQTEQSNEVSLKNTPDHKFIKDATIEEVRYVKPLEMLKNKDFVLVKNEINFPQITDIFIKKDVKPLRRPTYMSISFMPLQTYRILTVNNRNIQNLQTNNLFDAERNGWAFELGITKSIGNKWNFRSNISYLKMRQWAEYQVNTDNISVKNSNNSNALLSANTGNEYIGQTRIEAKTLQMVGVKADVQRFFKISARNRYFISGGSQLMVEPIEKQTNVFINASAGFQHVVNKDCFLTIEPTASYLLNNINDSKSLIQTNAYNLGLKVGVSFRVK